MGWQVASIWQFTSDDDGEVGWYQNQQNIIRLTQQQGRGRRLTTLALSLLLHRRLNVGSWPGIMLITTKSMVQLLAMVWMPATQSRVSDTSLRLSIVVVRVICLETEGQEVAAHSESFQFGNNWKELEKRKGVLTHSLFSS